MYKYKTIYPRYKNQKLSHYHFKYLILKEKFFFWFLFMPIAWLITTYYNTKKTLGIHKVKELELLEDPEAFLEEIGLILTEEELERKL